MIPTIIGTIEQVLSFKLMMNHSAQKRSNTKYSENITNIRFKYT